MNPGPPPDMGPWHFLGDWLFWGYFLMLVPYLTFGIFYAVRSPWRTTAAGRALMILDVTLVVVLIRAVLNSALGMNWPGRDAMAILMLVGGFVSGWYLLWVLLRLQDRGRRLLDTQKQDEAKPEHRDKRIRRARRKAIRTEQHRLDVVAQSGGERVPQDHRNLAQARIDEAEIERNE